MIPIHLHDGTGIMRYLVRLSPLIGGPVTLIALFQAGSVDSSWKFMIPIIIGVTITLVGMLFHGHETRIVDLEEHSLTHREFRLAYQPLKEEVDRIETHLKAIDERDIRKRGM